MDESAETFAAPSRRAVTAGLTAALMPVAVPKAEAQAWNDVAVRIAKLVGDAKVTAGRVKLTLPALAENGNLVALTVAVESPMTPKDHVTSIYLFSERNPVATLAAFHLQPDAGRARVQTNVRLGATQNVIAIARMNNGTFWSDTAAVTVTVAACVDGG